MPGMISPLACLVPQLGWLGIFLFSRGLSVWPAWASSGHGSFRAVHIFRDLLMGALRLLMSQPRSHTDSLAPHSLVTGPLRFKGGGSAWGCTAGGPPPQGAAFGVELGRASPQGRCLGRGYAWASHTLCAFPTLQSFSSLNFPFPSIHMHLPASQPYCSLTSAPWPS